MEIDLIFSPKELKLIYLAVAHECDKDSKYVNEYEKLEEKIFNLRHMD